MDRKEILNGMFIKTTYYNTEFESFDYIYINIDNVDEVKIFNNTYLIYSNDYNSDLLKIETKTQSISSILNNFVVLKTKEFDDSSFIAVRFSLIDKIYPLNFSTSEVRLKNGKVYLVYNSCEEIASQINDRIETIRILRNKR